MCVCVCVCVCVLRMEQLLHWANTLVVDPLLLRVESNPANTPLDFDYSLLRQSTVMTVMLILLAYVSYFALSGLSYLTTFVVFRRYFFPGGVSMEKGQIGREIRLSCSSIITMSILTVPFELLTLYRYTNVYFDVNDYPIAYMFLCPFLFLIFTDTCIYWIHYALHWGFLYRWLHKQHHDFLEVTPFSSLAFHPVDGWAQGMPYHLFVMLFPMHTWMYLISLFVVNLWTINIHDRLTMNIPGVNGAKHHDIHHRTFRGNYGQYLQFWDRINGTYRDPTDEKWFLKQNFSKYAEEQDKAAGFSTTTTSKDKAD